MTYSHRLLAAGYVVDLSRCVVAAFATADLDLAAAVAELARAVDQYDQATARDEAS